MDESEIVAFKKRIGWERLSTENHRSGVVIDWENIKTLIDREFSAYECEDDALHAIGIGMARRSLSYVGEDGELEVEVWVSGQGSDDARRCFIDRATAISLWYVPSQVVSPPLGEIAVADLAPESEAVAFIFRNVYLKVENTGPRRGAIDLARKIHALLATHLVDDLSRLPIAGIKASPSAPGMRVGERIDIRLQCPAEVKPSGMLVDFWKGQNPCVNQVAQGASVVTYEGVEPGQVNIEVRVIDRKTLLSPSLRVTFEVIA